MKNFTLYLLTILLFGCSTQDTEGPQGGQGTEDTDGDGVIGSMEITDGTDPSDPCSFLLSSQSVETSSEWDQLDCDNDCVSNSSEVFYGTDPLTPDSPRLNQIYDSSVETPFNFRGSGPYYTGYVVPGFGQVSSSYTYSGDQLTRIRFTESDQGVLYEVSFSYTGEQIDQITIDGPNSKSVVYQGNEIIATSGVSPLNLFETKIHLDSEAGHVIKCEKYVNRGSNNYDYYIFDYIYSSGGENVIQRDVEQYSYDADTEEYMLNSEYSESYSYNNLVNPAREAYKGIYIHTLLASEPNAYWNISGNYLQVYEVFALPAIMGENLIETITIGNSNYDFIYETCNSDLNLPDTMTFFGTTYFNYRG